jgi:phthiocerol/phenolphthiocerol synthesis type-I polyketide synthase E
MTENAVAIVGLACRVPGAGDAAQFWRNLKAGKESLSRFSVDDLVAGGLDPAMANDPAYIPIRGKVDGAELFDHAFFGMGPAEAAGTDPQHRLFLEACSSALDDAGIDPQRFDGWIGVFAGCNMVNPDLPDIHGDEMARLLGYENDFLCTRVAYKLGLRGPALTLQTACSTSLVAVHQAAQSLLGYECDAALAGGVSVWFPQAIGYLHQEGSIMSADGHCRPFDAAATGTVGGNGLGVVVLRRLDDALRDGDRIIAVLRGSAINNDGGTKIGYVAPSIEGQRDVIRLAIAQSGVDPGDINYVEAHGTGTRVGDPIEFAALTSAFREGTDQVGGTWLGAVKSNIGHLGPASGVAGLIKVALMLRHRTLVPTVHFRSPNPELEIETSPFRVAADTRPFDGDGPLLAGISSFGMGGTNSHAVLESAPVTPSRRAGRGRRIFLQSAASPQALRTARTELADAVTDDLDLADVAWTLSSGRRQFPHRAAVVAADSAELVAGLRTEVEPVRADGADVALLFPGQGALRSGFGAAAYRLLPTFREVFDDLSTLARTRFGVDLGVVRQPDVDPIWLRDTGNQQLALFAIGLGFAETLRSWGIRPAAMLGHSIGEYVAATVAGVWTPEVALGLIHSRGAAMRAAPPGRMLMVTVGPEQVEKLLATHPGLTLAVDGPGHAVLAGPPEVVEAVRATGIECRVLDTERAFHSPMIEGAAQHLGRAVAAAPAGTPKLPFLSNLTGDWADPAKVVDAGYWVDHLTGTVRLAANVTTLLSSSAKVFLELGPGRSMSGMLRGHPLWTPDRVAVPFAGGSRQDEEAGLLDALARLWERGFTVDTLVTEARKCSLPAHPFVHSAYTPTVRSRSKPVVVGGGEDVLREIWFSATGTSSVHPDDDFYAVGGESLTSIQLLGKVRDRLGVTVPLTTFTTRPTFGHLLELVGQHAKPAADSANLLTFNANGSLPPLFLAAPAAGSSLVYRRLAGLLGDDQPCYGLESVGLHDGARPLRRFEDIASHNIDALRSVRPHGPYVLGGWSVGAMVAHEMARQLLDAGEQVVNIIAVDACVITTGGRPMGADPFFTARAVRLMSQIRWQHWRSRRDPVSARDIGGLGTNFVDVFNANLMAMLRYRPTPIPCDITIYPTSPGTGYLPRLRRRVAPLYLGTTTITPVPGDHYSILDTHIETLAGHVREDLGIVQR